MVPPAKLLDKAKVLRDRLRDRLVKNRLADPRLLAESEKLGTDFYNIGAVVDVATAATDFDGEFPQISAPEAVEAVEICYYAPWESADEEKVLRRLTAAPEVLRRMLLDADDQPRAVPQVVAHVLEEVVRVTHSVLRYQKGAVNAKNASVIVIVAQEGFANPTERKKKTQAASSATRKMTVAAFCKEAPRRVVPPFAAALCAAVLADDVYDRDRPLWCAAVRLATDMATPVVVGGVRGTRADVLAGTYTARVQNAHKTWMAHAVAAKAAVRELFDADDAVFRHVSTVSTVLPPPAARRSRGGPAATIGIQFPPPASEEERLCFSATSRVPVRLSSPEFGPRFAKMLAAKNGLDFITLPCAPYHEAYDDVLVVARAVVRSLALSLDRVVGWHVKNARCATFKGFGVPPGSTTLDKVVDTALRTVIPLLVEGMRAIVYEPGEHGLDAWIPLERTGNDYVVKESCQQLLEVFDRPAILEGGDANNVVATVAHVAAGLAVMPPGYADSEAAPPHAALAAGLRDVAQKGLRAVMDKDVEAYATLFGISRSNARRELPSWGICHYGNMHQAAQVALSEKTILRACPRAMCMTDVFPELRQTGAYKMMQEVARLEAKRTARSKRQPRASPSQK